MQVNVSMKKFRVLVADSTASLRQFIKYSLEDHYDNITIEAASNGKNIQRRIEQNQFNLIIYDRGMPLLDGDEFLSWLRSHQALKDMPVIITSTNSEMESLKRAAELGANAYIIKPFKVDALVSKVAEILGESKKKKYDRRKHRRWEMKGNVHMKFGEHESTGNLVDISRGGLLAKFDATPPYPHVLDKVMVNVQLKDGMREDAKEGIIVRIDATDTIAGATHVCFAVHFRVPLSADIEKQIMSYLPKFNFS
jgi:CheY-like chemotaxis protein